MPNNRVYQREKHRKKARHSSDSDSDREDSRRRYREKSRDHNKRRYSKDRDRNSKSRSSRGRKRYSSSSSSSSSDSSRRSRDRRTSSSSSSSSESSDDRRKNSKKTTTKSGPSNTTNTKFYDTKTKFDLHDLYGKDSDRPSALKDIESDSFQQRDFQSKNIVVDLKKDQVIVPETSKPAEREEESLIHPDFLGDENAKVEKWLKKLYLYRKQIQ